MRKSLTAVFLALAPVAALTTLAPVAPAYAQQAEVSVSLFYDQLSTHGKWVEHPRWGWVWYPNDVDQDWRPYTRGRWVWTQEYGWYWASTEPFGWATYHYGRWGYDEQYGWVWVPGDRWAASWVAFRYSDRAVGWAPLPPDTLQVTGSVTVDDGVFTAAYYQPRWVFVEARYFADADIHARVVPVARNVTYIRETRNVTNITMQNNVFVNRSFEPQRIRTVVGREIPTVRVNRVTDVNRLDIRARGDVNITQINIYNPQVRIERDRQPPERARARESDRPRVSVRPELVRPEDRRAPGDRERTRPGAPPSQTQPAQPGQPAQPRTGEQDRRDRTTPGAPPGRQGAQPEQDPRNRTTPGAPPSATPGTPNRTQPNREGQKPGETPRGQQDDRRGERPGLTPPRTAPGAPPSRGTNDDKRGATPATPAQPPRAMPGAPPSRGQPDEKRGAAPATPAQPPKAAPGAPPSRGQPDEKRGATPATPAQPPKLAPGAPPSRQGAPPQSQPPQRGQQPPQKPGQSDEKKEAPNR